MFAWFRRRASRALVESDAADLIARFGAAAYLETRLRQHDDARVIDGNRPPGHWTKVKARIAEMTAQPPSP
jgi:hypothetical protein